MWSPDNHSCTNNLALEEVTVSDTLVRAVATGAHGVPWPSTQWRLMKAPILLAFLGLATAQAAEPTGTLTLACEGTATQDTEPDAKQPISMGIVLNFTTRTVQGFPHIGGAEITKVDDGHIVFVARYHGSKEVHDEWGFVGTIDRVTDDLKAHWMLMNMETGNFRIVAYSLKCKTTQRML